MSEPSSFPVTTSRGLYEVTVGYELLDQAVDECDVLIADPRATAGREWDRPVVSVEARESHKDLAGVERVLIGLHEAGIRRRSSVLAVGGGVIQDMATLAASIYMRGISWAYAPSTMMAMLDSCIGGKSSINVAGVKNLVGNIYPPNQVTVDLALAQTLPTEARIAGYAEAVKICYAAGAQPFDEFLNLHLAPEDYGSHTAKEPSIHLTTHVLTSKRWFIEIDEFDKNERLLLNYGHTFAHALEPALNFAIPHGVAVAIGMAAANRFTAHKATRTTQLSTYIAALACSLPAEFAKRLVDPDWDRFAKALAADKKGTPSHLRFVLPNSAGDLELHEEPRNDGTLKRALAATKEALDSFRTSIPQGDD